MVETEIMPMRIHGIAFALSCVVFVTACAKEDHVASNGTPVPGPPAAPTSTPTAAPAATSPAPAALDRTRWSLVESQLAAPAPEETGRVGLEFTADRLSANSGCNTGSGGYRIAGGRLVLSPMATTRRACMGPAAVYEPVFFAMLGSRPAIRLEKDGEELVLESQGADRSNLLRFSSVPMPSASAVQKFIYVASERVACTGVAPMQCLQVRSSPDEPWQPFHGEIIGFDPEPGIEYRLRIYEDDLPNPPTDGSSKRWFLDMVVEQRVVKP